MRFLLLFLVGSIGARLDAQPPAISQNGITNDASRIPSSLSDWAIARGAAFSIQGVRLGTDASNTHLELLSSGRSIPLLARSVQPRQIQAFMPGKAPLGPGSIIVETPEGRSKPFSVRVVPAQPGLYSANGKGWGQGQIRMLDSDGGWKVNRMESPMRRGGTAAIDATGLASEHRAEIVIAGIRVAALGIDHSTATGVDRIRFRVPRTIPEGCFVPVYLRIGAARPSNVVSMAIEDSGSSCHLLIPVPRPDSLVGIISIARLDSLNSNASPVTTSEQANALFGQNSDDQIQNPMLVSPPDGTCTAFYGDARSDWPGLDSIGEAFESATKGRGLSAGRALSISGSGGVRVIPASPGELGAYAVRLGLEEPGRQPAPAPFLKDPHYTVSAEGAEKIGPFAREIPGPPVFEWTNGPELATIDRSQGATFQWRGVPPDARMFVVATGANSIGAARGVTYCAANAASGGLTIPAEMLANLPSTEAAAAPPTNIVFLIALRIATDSTVPVKGLDEIWTVSIYATVRQVSYR